MITDFYDFERINSFYFVRTVSIQSCFLPLEADLADENDL